MHWPLSRSNGSEISHTTPVFHGTSPVEPENGNGTWALLDWRRDIGDSHFQSNRVFRPKLIEVPWRPVKLGEQNTWCQELRQRTGLHLSGQCLNRNHQITIGHLLWNAPQCPLGKTILCISLGKTIDRLRFGHGWIEWWLGGLQVPEAMSRSVRIVRRILCCLRAGAPSMLHSGECTSQGCVDLALCTRKLITSANRFQHDNLFINHHKSIFFATLKPCQFNSTYQHNKSSSMMRLQKLIQTKNACWNARTFCGYYESVEDVCGHSTVCSMYTEWGYRESSDNWHTRNSWKRVRSFSVAACSSV